MAGGGVVAAFRVDPVALAGVVELMAVFDRRVEEHLVGVDAAAQQLAGSWEGEMAQAAAEAQRRWQAGSAQMRAALVELTGFLGGAQRGYATVVRSNGQAWGID